MAMRIPHHKGEGEAITIQIPSFTDPNKSYAVTLDSDGSLLSCGCKRFEFTGGCSKHPALSESLLKARRRNAGSLAERILTELARKIFAPICGSPVESYELFVEVMANRYSGDRLKRNALRRHHKTLLADERGRAA